jgi:hypothetical protein
LDRAYLGRVLRMVTAVVLAVAVVLVLLGWHEY